MKKILLAIVCMVSGLCGCSESDSDNGPKGDSISLSKDLISLDFEGGTDEIVVTSSGDWRMSGTSTWAHPSVTEGKSGDTVVFTIDPNATDRNLQSEFKLFTGSAVARLTVTCGEGYVLSLDSDAAVSVLQSGGEFAGGADLYALRRGRFVDRHPRVHGCVRRPAPDLHGFGEQRLLGA